MNPFSWRWVIRGKPYIYKETFLETRLFPFFGEYIKEGIINRIEILKKMAVI
jgi:hypothetical protein